MRCKGVRQHTHIDFVCLLVFRMALVRGMPFAALPILLCVPFDLCALEGFSHVNEWTSQPIIYFHTFCRKCCPRPRRRCLLFFPVRLRLLLPLLLPFYYYVYSILLDEYNIVHKFKKVRLRPPLVFGWLNLCLLMWSENIHTVSILPFRLCIDVCASLKMPIKHFHC